VRIAYLILAHRHFDQLALLTRVLKEDWNEIFIHVDARAAFNEREFKAMLGGTSVHLVAPRREVHWAGASIVDATVNLIRCQRHVAPSCERIVLLSGQDLPLVPNKQIHSFFSNNSHAEYLEYQRFPVPWWPYGGWDRLRTYSFPHRLSPSWNRALRVIQMLTPFRRRNFRGITPFGSTQWFNITREAADEVLDWVDNTDILRQIRYSYGADEIFFATVLLNSRLASTCVNNSLRYMNWGANRSGPRIVTSADLDKVFDQPGISLFARKFDPSVNPEVIERVIRHIGKGALLD
jgi:hypothetical protein